jgi:5'-nucleotidase
MSLRILISNDDGIHARGLEVLEEIAREISDDVWIVAPEEDQSGAARSLTLSYPLRMRQVAEKRYTITGTPTDCVQMAVSHILPEHDGKKPDLVLSGVNNGQNLAEDVTLSGTIAAAFHGMQLGIPSIAFSLARFRRDMAQWDTPLAHGRKIITDLLDAGWPEEVVMNVNFPDRAPDDVGAVEITSQGNRDERNLFVEERTDLRSRKYYWFGFNGKLSNPPEGTDLRAIYEGRISITPLHLSLTDEPARAALKAKFTK